MDRTNTLSALVRRPHIAALYLLVYWGHTLFFVLLGASSVLWLVGAGPDRIYLFLDALAFTVAGFNLGLSVGEAGPPPGKRR